MSYLETDDDVISGLTSELERLVRLAKRADRAFREISIMIYGSVKERREYEIIKVLFRDE